MNDSVARQIADLPNLHYDELKYLWRTHFGNEPPIYSKPPVINRLAHRIQEHAYGELSYKSRDFMRSVLIANGFDDNGCKPGSQQGTTKHPGIDKPVLGTKLTRQWNGKLYEVTVVRGGFEYEEIRYRSLTAVAKAITGTHWNGRKFFAAKPTKGGEK